MNFAEINILPENVLIQKKNEWIQIENNDSGVFKSEDLSVNIKKENNKLRIYLTSEKTPVCRVALRWKREMKENISLLGDAWERGYGDLEWRGIVPQRVMPWYFMLYDGMSTHGYGVKTGPSAMCFWQVSKDDIMLYLDVRNGGVGVELAGRTLHMATVVTREGNKSESAFEATTAFCKIMCDAPRLPKFPVYGSNNWYYAYGNSSHEEVAKDAEIVVKLSPKGANKPFMVIDDGWQLSHNGGCTGGPWNIGNYKFPDMKGLAQEIIKAGAKPGIWIRPLCTIESYPYECLLDNSRFKGSADHEFYIDPSHPYVINKIEEMVRGIKEWGYELIKHDFSTFDIFGRWGFEMEHQLTNNDWHFYDRSKTTAEIILDMYRAIRKGAGEDVIIIGCNTVSHLSAGIFEIQRTGDDTSGLEWERTRKMGVNTLAFRMQQHNTFYAVDADCVGITDKVDWELNKQWLDILSSSGTPLFISADPKTLTEEKIQAMKEAFSKASKYMKLAEPVDWMNTTCPTTWKCENSIKRFKWSGGCTIADISFK